VIGELRCRRRRTIRSGRATTTAPATRFGTHAGYQTRLIDANARREPSAGLSACRSFERLILFPRPTWTHRIVSVASTVASRSERTPVAHSMVTGTTSPGSAPSAR